MNSKYNPELFKNPRVSEQLAKMAQDSLDRLGHYPGMKEEIEGALLDGQNETLFSNPASIGLEDEKGSLV